MCQNMYKKRVNILFKSANDILLSWQQIDMSVNNMSSYINKKYLKEYRSEIKKILKDLHNISRELKRHSLSPILTLED